MEKLRHIASKGLAEGWRADEGQKLICAASAGSLPAPAPAPAPAPQVPSGNGGATLAVGGLPAVTLKGSAGRHLESSSRGALRAFLQPHFQVWHVEWKWEQWAEQAGEQHSWERSGSNADTTHPGSLTLNDCVAPVGSTSRERGHFAPTWGVQNHPKEAPCSWPTAAPHSC